MRLRFPHLVTGSVSSSGPLFAKLDFPEYLQVVAEALDTTCPGCNVAIKEAITRVERMVETEETVEELRNKFKLCSKLDGLNKLDVRNFMEILTGNIAGIVQGGEDIFSLCGKMTDESLGNPIDRLATLIRGETCLEHTYQSSMQDLTNITWPTGPYGPRQWTWQTCNEFGWYQTTNQVLSSYFYIA